jgi:hypothetical protein
MTRREPAWWRRSEHVGEYEECGGCAGPIIRVVPVGMPLGFGQTAYRHVNQDGCPGGAGARRLIAAIERRR